jgi:hypothetical protein
MTVHAGGPKKGMRSTNKAARNTTRYKAIQALAKTTYKIK